MDEKHRDFATLSRIRRAIYERVRGPDQLAHDFPALVRDAIESVVDPVRTARTQIADLDNVEKTFIGLKIEHYFRDLLDVPKGLRDLKLDGLDVDVKNTVMKTWMIPPETYRNEDPCVLIATAEADGYCKLGLMLARDAYLSKPNRDQKRGVGKVGKENIMWLLERAALPASPWIGIDMKRFRELRKLNGGAARAAVFFRENLDKPVHRAVIQALLFDQRDYMKRLRENGGARNILKKEGIALLSGVYDAPAAKVFGIALDREHFVSVAPQTVKEKAAAGF